MSKPNLISYSEWMAELERLKSEVPESRGLTMQELVKQTGRSEIWIARRVLKPLLEQGRLQTFKRRCVDLAGRNCWKTEYLPKGVSNEKKEQKTG